MLSERDNAAKQEQDSTLDMDTEKQNSHLDRSISQEDLKAQGQRSATN